MQHPAGGGIQQKIVKRLARGSDKRERSPCSNRRAAGSAQEDAAETLLWREKGKKWYFAIQDVLEILTGRRGDFTTDLH